MNEFVLATSIESIASQEAYVIFNVVFDNDIYYYLGSRVDTRGGAEADVKTRISKARAAFILY